MQSLRSAFSTKFADQKTKDLKDAERSLTQAVTSGKQEKNPAAWYYLGRYYLMVHDVVGADSALSKALALAPACKEDIGLYRRQEWVGVFNAGVQAWQGGQSDSAIASFRRANQIYQAEPMGFVYIANLFVGREEPDSAGKKTDAAKYHMDSVVYATHMDSAAKHFRLAVGAASDSQFAGHGGDGRRLRQGREEKDPRPHGPSGGGAVRAGGGRHHAQVPCARRSPVRHGRQDVPGRAREESLLARRAV